MSCKRKLKTFNYSGKIEIAFFEASEDQRQCYLINELQILEFTHSKIIKKKEVIEKAASDVDGYINRQKTCEYPDIEKTLSEWLK